RRWRTTSANAAATKHPAKARPNQMKIVESMAHFGPGVAAMSVTSEMVVHLWRQQIGPMQARQLGCSWRASKISSPLLSSRVNLRRRQPPSRGGRASSGHRRHQLKTPGAACHVKSFFEYDGLYVELFREPLHGMPTFNTQAP